MEATFDCGGEILILTGPPGSGKTTTSTAIAALPGSAKVHLHSDDFWHFIKHGRIAPYLPEAHQQNGVVMNALAKVVGTFARAGYFVVLDGIVGPWFLEPFRALALPIHYVAFLPPVETALQRCIARGSDTLTDPGPIAELHRQFSDLGSLKTHVLETSSETPDELVELVIHAVITRRFLL